MKISGKYILIALALPFLTSCNDILDEHPQGSYDESVFFDSQEHAEMAIYGILSSLSENTHYGWYEMATPASDDTYFTSRTYNDNGIHDIVHYTATSTNTVLEKLWQLKYEALDRANRAIAGIEGMANFSSDSNLRALAGEARFLRAFVAFDLVKAWGDVPFPTESTDEYSQAFLPRTGRESIYDCIVTDLELAAGYLSWANASTTPERATAGAAHALLMRVLMQRAGYSLQADGTLKRPSDSERTKLFRAVTDNWEAIEAQGYHGFCTAGYDGFFKNLSYGTADSKESLWQISMLQEQGRRNGSAWGIYNGPLVAEPTGIPSNEASAYMGRTNAFFIVVPEWRDFYEDNDVRRDINICTYQYRWNAETREHTKSERANTGWYVGKWRREWMNPADWNKNINYGDIDFVALRYPDMALLAAEAYNELGETSKAWTLISSVRTRAGASAVDAASFAKVYAKPKATRNPVFIDDASEQGKVRQALYFERAFELCFEGIRKYDLLRWGCLYDALKLFGENSVVNQKALAYPGYKNFIPGCSELQPIPLKEIQSNPALNGINNPGY
ncbi:MAG: RagB/SusD family nutrient uptake outer membrane protein [Muribaculaceae bacterium]|nr:RagB/SusD family nutrient uptake outer membrane protein [Muribaculaceae bacterium]